ncbi:alpha/beta hydrolase [Kribbella qitaiheensis]|uniref:alpha/beta hydrolase n=1 Tax=Kribbella qitaiheensis TaxID=1544730 RepID=UPI00361D4B33
MNLRLRRAVAGGAVLATALAGVTFAPAPATATAVPETTAQGLRWSDCLPEAGDTEEDKELLKGSQCTTLQVPVDWNRPHGPTFGLALARRPAKDPSHRAGSLVFGPGGPGDSGVERIRTGMSRFSANLQDRFDILSFDPRGIARSNPVKCSAALLAQQPSPIIRSQAEFDQTLRYNRKLSKDCRANTGPVYDHIDSLQTVHDLDAIRAALGESKLTFHGSSYGTLLGELYAETYPSRVRAIVLESVVDHSLGTSAFLDTQTSTAQDSFDEFVKWCDANTACVLHGRDIPALWASLLARADRGKLPNPKEPNTTLPPFMLSYLAFRQLYDPQWPVLAGLLKQLDESKPPVVVTPPAPTGLQSNTFAVFCQDWSLPVNSYSQYSAQLKRLARDHPEMKYPGALLAIASCLGSPTQVDNPQHRLKIRGLQTPLLLINSIHDPAAGYNWATNVARQLGRQGVLLTYEGWGHGSYTTSPCVEGAVDSYLVSLRLPARGDSCPAIPPA